MMEERLVNLIGKIVIHAQGQYLKVGIIAFAPRIHLMNIFQPTILIILHMGHFAKCNDKRAILTHNKF